MAKQLNVNLAFTADTKQVKTQLQDLQKQLTNLINKPTAMGSLGITKEIEQASVAAASLKSQLEAATNVNTGKLDLGKFNQSLKQSGYQIKDYRDALLSLGPEGAKAFSTLAQSITTAEVPLRRSSALLTEFATTLKNTARWQISSSILHGFMGSIQHAYGYAQDLNESLNNIRIVTGQSVDQMAKFASEANKAAQALSTTTTEYTNASLIYYQQGLSDSEVKERTDVTVKMANVTRESAEEVSQQMTAVWNNFDDGSKSLEYYADVMTALGAATASSTDEIAEGLEKFASVSETVGLSYEYATAALATVTATTRQSADIVGNAFKTIFARIEGLKLGETLEDGTDLNKYSQALAAVGINIKDTDGELKEMDQILDELGAKWQTLGKDQQVALAQTVAGVRQYTYMIALMDKWDFFQENLGVAKGSEGTLQEQAEIYAESWEAARDRVTAAAEEIYGQLLNDDFFIDLLNGFEKVLDTISNVIDAFGGLRGVVPLIGSMMLKTFGPDLANSINNIKYNIQSMTKAGREAIVQTRMDMVNALKDITDDAGYQGPAQTQTFQIQADLQEQLIKKSVEIESINGKIAQSEQEQIKRLMDINTELGKAYVNSSKEREQQEEIAGVIQKQLQQKVDATKTNIINQGQKADSFQQAYSIGGMISNKYFKNVNSDNWKNIQNELNALKSNLQEVGADYSKFENQLNQAINATSFEQFSQSILNFDQRINIAGNDAERNYNKIIEVLKEEGMTAAQAESAVRKLQEAHEAAAKATFEEARGLGNLNQHASQTSQAINKLKAEELSLGEVITSTAQGLASFAMVLSSIKGISDVLNDDDLSPWERFVSILSTAGMMFPMIVSSVKTFTGVMTTSKVATEGATAAQWGLNAAMDANPVGVITLGITALIGAITAAVAIYDKFTMSVEEADEKLEELNTEMKDSASNQASMQGNIDELEKMQKEYDELSEKAGQYDRDIDNLTDAERERYNEIKDKIAECNETSVAYYTDQGEAILRNNDSLRDTIDLLKEKIGLERASVYTEDFNEKNKAHNTKYKNAQKEVDAAQEYYDSLTNPNGNYGGSGLNYEDFLIQNMQSYNLANIRSTLAAAGVSTDETTEAFTELSEIVGNGIDAIKQAEKEGKFAEYQQLLETELKNAGFAGQVENVNAYLEGIVNQADEYQDMIDKAGGDLEKARVNADALAKIDLSWVLGVVKYVEDNNDGYELLTNAGIDNADAYITAYANGLTLGSSTDLNGDLIENYDDVYNAINLYEEQLFNAFSKNPKLQENLEKAGKDFSENTFTSYQDYVNQLQKTINDFIENNPGFKDLDKKTKEALLNSIFGTGNLNFDTDGFVTRLNTKYTEALTKLQNQLAEKTGEKIDNQDLTDLIPYEQLDNLDYIINNLDEATLKTEGWQAAIEEVLASLEETQKYDFASSTNDSLTSVMSRIQSGDLTAENIASDESYKNILKNLDKIKEKYPELTAAADMLGNTWLVGTQEYSEALEEVQDKMYELKLATLQEEARTASDALGKLFTYDEDGAVIDISADSEEFESTMNELLNAEYAVDVAIHTEADQEFDSISAAMEDIATQSAYIGDDFIVAADKVRELNNTFPGILEGMEIVGDGTVKLNQEVVQSAMGMAEAEVQADAQATVDKLHNQATLLRAKQASYQNMANAALVLANAETHTDEESAAARATISAELANLQELNSQEATQSSNNNAKETADAAQANGQVVAKNWESAFQAMADASYQAATIAINNMNAVESGGKAVQGTVSVEYNGSSGVDKEASIIQQTQDALEGKGEDTTDWAKMAEAYAQMADQAGAAANDIEGMIAQIGATATNVDKQLGGVSRGAGSNGKRSGGGSEAKDPDQKDYAEDEIDRYYDINNAISAVNQELERNEQLQKKLDSMQDHYAGKTLIKSLQRENELLKQKNDALDSQYANYQKLYEIQSQELAELQSKLGGSWNGNELQNYSQLFQENLNRYNAAIDAYNAMSAEQQEASGKQMIEDAKTAYDEYKEALERYQDLYYNEMYDTENKLAELRQQQLENQLKIIENNLQAWETDVELKLDTTEAERNLNDFFKDVEQDFRKIYEDLTLDSAFDTKNFNTFFEDAETQMTQIKDVMAEIDKMEASKDAEGVVQLSDDMMFGSISEAQEYLKKLQGELVDTGNSLNDMYEQVWDNYIDGLDQAADNFADINDEFDHITNKLEYEKELIELVYGDKAYDLMNKYYETQSKNLNEQIASTRTQAEFWENQFNEAYNMNKDKHNVDLNDMSTWTEDMKKAYEEMIDSQKKLNDLVLEGIQNLRDEYLNNVAKTLSEMDKAIWGMDFEDIKEDWDFIQKKADEYLDDVEGAYQIQTLANKIDNSIAETSSLKNQQKLADLREEEINYLREKENLTQSDIDLAEARYQIALKEMALEDAQNNKTSMKLNRDESGNWTYQYVADEEDTATKQQELLDAYNKLYETADSAYNHALELAMSTYEEYKEKLNALAEDVNLTEEEKYIKMQELRDMYLPEITAAMENANIYEQETIYATGAVFAEVCEQDADAYYTLTDLQKALVDEVRDQHLSDYEEIRDAILNNYDEIGTKAKDTFSETNENSKTNAAAVIDQWDGKSGSVKTAFQDAFDSIVKYTQNFENELGVLEQVSNKKITDPNGVIDDFNKLGDKIDEVGGKTQDMAATAAGSLDELRGFVDNVEQAWEQVISRIREAISALQEYIATMSEAISAASSPSGGGNPGGGPGGGSPDGSGGGSPQGGLSASDIEGIAGNIWVYGDWGNNPTRHSLLQEKFGTADGDAIYNAVQGMLNSGYGYNGGLEHDWDYYKQFSPSAYATGGYTGEWDTSGKLAILHEKELVLNAEDTANMLNAVRVIRDITGLNDSISATIASSIGQLVLSAMAATPGNYNTTSSENANNVFNITAEFPNADDVQTIRDAILSLPNLASQFIHQQ